MPDKTPAITVTLQHTAKPPLRSRTLWLNALALALALAESQLQLLQPLLGVNAYALLAFFLPIANVMLRMVTSEPLDFGGGTPPPVIEPSPPEAP